MNIERMLMVILILTYCLITCTRYRTVITIMVHKMLRYCTLKVLHNSLHLKIDDILCPDFGMVGHVVFTTRSSSLSICRQWKSKNRTMWKDVIRICQFQRTSKIIQICFKYLWELLYQLWFTSHYAKNKKHAEYNAVQISWKKYKTKCRWKI